MAAPLFMVLLFYYFYPISRLQRQKIHLPLGGFKLGGGFHVIYFSKKTKQFLESIEFNTGIICIFCGFTEIKLLSYEKKLLPSGSLTSRS